MVSGVPLQKSFKDLGNMALFAQPLFIIELGDRTDFAGELRMNLPLDFLRLMRYRKALLDSFSLRVDI